MDSEKATLDIFDTSAVVTVEDRAICHSDISGASTNQKTQHSGGGI